MGTEARPNLDTPASRNVRGGDAANDPGAASRGGTQPARAGRRRDPMPSHHSSPFNPNFLPLLWTPARTHWLNHILPGPPPSPAYW